MVQIRSTLISQLPWFLTVAVLAAGNGLTRNPYVRLAADAECVAYGLLLMINYRDLALLPPWRRRSVGRTTGLFIIVIGLMVSAGAFYQLFT